MIDNIVGLRGKIKKTETYMMQHNMKEMKNHSNRMSKNDTNECLQIQIETMSGLVQFCKILVFGMVYLYITGIYAQS